MQAYRGSRASLISSDDGSTFYGYFQDPDGKIVETSFTGSTFVSLGQNIVVDAGSTFGGSPIAATTWTSGSGTTYVRYTEQLPGGEMLKQCTARSLLLESSSNGYGYKHDRHPAMVGTLGHPDE